MLCCMWFWERGEVRQNAAGGSMKQQQNALRLGEGFGGDMAEVCTGLPQQDKAWLTSLSLMSAHMYLHAHLNPALFDQHLTAEVKHIQRDSTSLCCCLFSPMH